MFYTNSAHAKLVSRLKRLETEQKLQTEYLVKREQVACNLRLTQLKIDNETLLKKLELVEKARLDERKMLLKNIEASKKTKWWRNPQFNFWTGFVLAGVISGLATWGASKLVK